MPYEKILELVEAKELDITTVNLAKITGDFIAYVQELKSEVEPRVLANFVAAAATLLLIKSKALLPSLELTEEEEADVKEFERRLALYKEFKAAGGNISRLWQEERYCCSRPYLAQQKAVFYYPPRLEAGHLLAALKKLAVGLEELETEEKDIKIHVISLENKIKELVQRFARWSKQKFSQLVANRSRGEVVATFLAILHLLKEKTIAINQPELFDDITIEKI